MPADQGFAGRELALLRALLEQGPEVTLLVDHAAGKILDAAGPLLPLLGRSAEQLRGQALACLRPRRAPAHLAVLGPMHLQGSGRWEEVALAGPGEEVRVCTLTVLPVDAESGSLVLLRLADVTGRVELQKNLQQMHVRLQQAYRELESSRRQLEEHRRAASLSLFAAGLAHEVNNPLSIAISNLSSAGSLVRDLSASGDRELARELVQVMDEISSSLERVAAIVALLRELEYRPRPAPLELAGWLRARPWLRGVELQGPQRLQVTCDATALERICRRLVDNARRAVEATGTVALEYGVTAAELVITVSDDGAGMPAEVLERACDPFFTTRPPGEGLGLGLFLARRAAALLGGELELQAPAGARGCRATLRLPRDGSGATTTAVSYEGFRTKPGGS